MNILPLSMVMPGECNLMRYPAESAEGVCPGPKQYRKQTPDGRSHCRNGAFHLKSEKRNRKYAFKKNGSAFIALKKYVLAFFMLLLL